MIEDLQQCSIESRGLVDGKRPCRPLGGDKDGQHAVPKMVDG